ncbi:lectin C-type domain protein [Elysia marginata]|uniref:Lectin C-type domain protein n=1 Tax=Elysia marginata TaxID=1093978 RepID=A0AAV4J0B5_9GAST|nr:lectin C-type domain protein [Elysia marginata]
MSSQFATSANTSGKTLEEIHTLKEKLDGLEAQLEAINTRTRIHSTLLAIDLTKFDVSDVYEGRVYLASKTETMFNLQSANAACQAAGGYLLEIDDNDENQYTFDFAKRLGGSDHFALGGNDIKDEGQFVYFNSKKPVPDHVTWMRGRPNNVGGKEHCMEIWPSQGGLNDIPCNTKAKFVCEVPLRF